MPNIIEHTFETFWTNPKPHPSNPIFLTTYQLFVHNSEQLQLALRFAYDTDRVKEMSVIFSRGEFYGHVVMFNNLNSK